MKKVVVSGADSFLAFHLIEALCLKGYEVTGCDVREGKNSRRLIETHKNFTFLTCDITDTDQVKKTFADADCIYHLAAVSSERFCKEEPVKSFEINVKGILNILNAVREKKPLFVFSSSASVYPDSVKPKKEEEASFTGKFYGTAKFTAEEYCRLFQKEFGVPYVIFRFSRLYGPRMERNPVFDISKGLVNNQKILLYEGLESNYDFIYVEDVVMALLTAMEDKWKNGTFNISSAKGVTLKELLNTYFKASGREVPFEVKRDVSQTDIVDNSKAVKLGFAPRVSLKEGLKKTYLYFSESKF